MTAQTPTVSRAERQARTRQSLIETGQNLFLRDGYAATSLDRVALEAGFSKGAVYSNFKNKEELCLAVLDSIHEVQAKEVVAAFSTGGTIEDRFDAFDEWARARIGHPRLTALEVEFASVARQSTFVATELAKRNAQMRAAIVALIESVREETGITIPMAPEEAATVLLSIGIGLGAQRSIDSTLDVDVFTRTMRLVIGLPDRRGDTPRRSGA